MNPGGLAVTSWAPTEGEEPTEVHLVVAADRGPVLVRFQAPEALDELVALLERERRRVFG